MIGSSIPGVATEVWRADTTSRLRAAAEGREAATLRRELRAQQAEQRSARGHAPVVARRRRVFLRAGRLASGWRV